MEPDVPKENLRVCGSMVRLGMMIGTNLLEKSVRVKRSQRLSVQHAHILSQINRMGNSSHIEGRLITGREMVRAICVWCSVRSERGQHWMRRDLYRITIDRQKPYQDVHHCYSAWMERYQELHGAREPSDEMKASMHISTSRLDRFRGSSTQCS
eukprot:12391-Pyramimonas_sp.AAC.1